MKYIILINTNDICGTLYIPVALFRKDINPHKNKNISYSCGKINLLKLQ